MVVVTKVHCVWGRDGNRTRCSHSSLSLYCRWLLQILTHHRKVLAFFPRLLSICLGGSFCLFFPIICFTYSHVYYNVLHLLAIGVNINLLFFSHWRCLQSESSEKITMGRNPSLAPRPHTKMGPGNEAREIPHLGGHNSDNVHPIYFKCTMQLSCCHSNRNLEF